jgi:hypothetical protein
MKRLPRPQPRTGFAGCAFRASSRGARRRQRIGARLAGLLSVTCLVGATAPAPAAELTAFVGRPSPTELWGKAYGATLTTTWFSLLALEAEAARHRGETEQSGMTLFTASAFLAPAIGRIVPYGGPGVGVFHQSVGSLSDTGTILTFALGARLKLGPLVLRAEWRRLGLSGEPLLPADDRYSAGIGVSF